MAQGEQFQLAEGGFFNLDLRGQYEPVFPAKELNVPVVLLCQLNRESEGRPGGRPELFHLRESGAIEQDADVVMLLYRPALARLTTDRESGYPTEGLGVVIVAKQRNGETGNAYFSHNPSLTKITDYTPPLEVLLKQAK